MPPENAPICLFPTYPKLTSSSNNEVLGAGLMELSIKNVTKNYGKKRALSNFSLDITAGHNSVYNIGMSVSPDSRFTVNLRIINSIFSVYLTITRKIANPVKIHVFIIDCSLCVKRDKSLTKLYINKILCALGCA